MQEISSLLKLRSIGQLGEQAAYKYLKQNLYYIIERNWRCNHGELDIIAKKGTDLIFVEVKTRNAQRKEPYNPIKAVDKRKQAQIKRLAHSYYVQNRKLFKRLKVHKIRYDIIGIWYRKGWGKRMKIMHVKNAF